MFTLYCTENELATKIGDVQLAAIQSVDAETAVPLLSWPVARGGQHGSVRIARGKMLIDSIDAALEW